VISGTQDYSRLLWAASLDAFAGVALAQLLTRSRERLERNSVLRVDVPRILGFVAVLNLAAYVVRERLDPGASGQSALLAFAVVALVLGAGLVFLSNRAPVAAGRGVIASSAVVLVLGLVGAARLQAGYGWNRYGTTLELDSGRRKSLDSLRTVTPTIALLATSHHSLPGDEKRARSYVYAAVSGRQMFVEGWEHATFPGTAQFERALEDNHRLFATKDPEVARRIVVRYGITHILCEPKQELPFVGTEASWLEPLQVPGDLRVYRVAHGR
jgi:hypothetical protein